MADLKIEIIKENKVSVFNKEDVDHNDLLIKGAPDKKAYKLTLEKHRDTNTNKIIYKASKYGYEKRVDVGMTEWVTHSVKDPKKDGPYFILSEAQFTALTKGGETAKAAINTINRIEQEELNYKDVKPLPLEKVWEDRIKKIEDKNKKGTGSISTPMQVAMTAVDASKSTLEAAAPKGDGKKPYIEKIDTATGKTFRYPIREQHNGMAPEYGELNQLEIEYFKTPGNEDVYPASPIGKYVPGMFSQVDVNTIHPALLKAKDKDGKSLNPDDWVIESTRQYGREGFRKTLGYMVQNPRTQEKLLIMVPYSGDSIVVAGPKQLLESPAKKDEPVTDKNQTPADKKTPPTPKDETPWGWIAAGVVGLVGLVGVALAQTYNSTSAFVLATVGVITGLAISAYIRSQNTGGDKQVTSTEKPRAPLVGQAKAPDLGAALAQFKSGHTPETSPDVPAHGLAVAVVDKSPLARG